MANCNIPSASSSEYGTFYGSDFTKVTIGESVTSIGSYAFYDCSSLHTLEIGSNVEKINQYAFRGCTSVETLVVKGSVMPEVPSDELTTLVLHSPVPLESKEFSKTVYRKCTLYVPQRGLERYQTTEPWSNFWNIAALETSGIENAEVDGGKAETVIYNLRGDRVEIPTKGIHIINGRKVLIK